MKALFFCFETGPLNLNLLEITGISVMATTNEVRSAIMTVIESWSKTEPRIPNLFL